VLGHHHHRHRRRRGVLCVIYHCYVFCSSVYLFRDAAPHRTDIDFRPGPAIAAHEFSVVIMHANTAGRRWLT